MNSPACDGPLSCADAASESAEDARLGRMRKLVRKELALKRVDKAIWREARDEGGGDRERARAAYIEARARKLLARLDRTLGRVETPAILGLRGADPPEPADAESEASGAAGERSLVDASGPDDGYRASGDAYWAWWPAIAAPAILALLAALALMVVVHSKQAATRAARVQEAEAAVEQGDFDRALLLWSDLAQQGITSAQLRLGLIYQDGLGVAPDPGKAAHWYELAARQGSADAQFYLGELYENGLGVPQDSDVAHRWYASAAAQYRRAAGRGEASAQLSLGGLYDIGYGVEQDYAEALRWYRAAAVQGDVVAQLQTGWMYRQGRGTAADAEQAAAWYRKAAEQGSAEAQVRLGFLYEQGIGVTRSRAEADRWYRAAAEHKDFDARAVLDDLAPR